MSARIIRLSALAAAVVLAVGVVAVGAPSARVDAANASLTEIGAPFATASFNGWVLDSHATGEVWSSPAVADVTGDGQPEIIVGGLNSIVRVYSTLPGHYGELIASIDPGGGDLSTANGATQASPAIGDMNNDGVKDIVIANTGGILSAYSLKGGVVSQIFRRYIAPGFNGALEGIFGTPALGYIDGDTSLDTVTGTWGQEVDAWSGSSATKIDYMHQWQKDTIWSSPAIGDVDGDGENEIVIGGDCDGSGPLQPCYGQGGGGYIYVYKLDGSLEWSHFVQNAVVWSTPALADLNNDGVLDVVVGTGLYYNGIEARKVIALNGKNGATLWEAPTSGAVVGSPSVGDVTGDSHPEVFAISRGGKLFSWNSDGSLRGSVCVTDGGCSGSETATHGGVALADIDGDGQVEAITQGEQQLKVFNAATLALEGSYRSSYAHTIFAGSSTPTVASVNGKTWIVTDSRGDGNDNGRDPYDDLVVQVWQSNSPLGAAPWPTFKQNMSRTSGPLPVPPNPVPNQNFVKQLYRDFLGREATTTEVNDWTSKLMNRQIDRYGVATALSRSDEWITTVVGNFYQNTLNRPPDASGLQGWIQAARSGMPVAQIASAFYSSPEYFSNVGHNDYSTWVADLYVKLLLRPGDQSGINGWVGALRNGMPKDTLAFGFYQSGETLGVRVTGLYQGLLGRPPENGAIPNWAPFVSNQGDLVLAAALAASNEYFAHAQTPH